MTITLTPEEVRDADSGCERATKERPILFQAPMVRAILTGMKTQTRRAIKPQPDGLLFGQRGPVPDNLYWHDGGLRLDDRTAFKPLRCPYGQSGDRLWVREAWRVGKGYDELPGSQFASPMVWHEADGTNMRDDRSGRYRHGRFMPRWASRILLEVTAVRVERLQDISEADCIAEGIDDGWLVREKLPPPRALAYRYLWEDISGAKPGLCWDANPFVWVVEFRRC